MSQDLSFHELNFPLPQAKLNAAKPLPFDKVHQDVPWQIVQSTVIFADLGGRKPESQSRTQRIRCGHSARTAWDLSVVTGANPRYDSEYAFASLSKRTMSERLRLTDISVKRESPGRLKPGSASKSEVVDANTDEEEAHKVAVFHRTERPVRDIPQVFDKIHRRNAHRLEEIMGGSGTMTVCPLTVSISGLIARTFRFKGLLGHQANLAK